MSKQITTWHKLFDTYQEACTIFKVGDLKKVKIDNTFICVGRTATSFFAISDKCTHEGISLSTGILKNNKIECPWHHFLFDISTGECSTHSCHAAKTYPIKINEEGFFIGE